MYGLNLYFLIIINTKYPKVNAAKYENPKNKEIINLR